MTGNLLNGNGQDQALSDLQPSANGTPVDTNSPEPNVDQLQQQTQGNEDLNAEAGGNPYDCTGSSCPKDLPDQPQTQQTQPPQPTAQQIQAQALKTQINGLSSAFNRFLSNPTDQNLQTLAARATIVSSQGGTFANSQIQALSQQLGGLAQAGNYFASSAVGPLSGYAGQISGGIGQAVGILNGIINKK
jgi:hypothetical protein